MMRAILIGTVLGTLGIGGAAVAQEAFTPRPIQGLEMAGGPVAPSLVDSGLEQNKVPGTPGAVNKRGPMGSGPGASPGKKPRITWPEDVPGRVKTMHRQIVEALGLTPQQSKSLQGLMVQKSKAFQARRATQKGAQKPGLKGTTGQRPVRAKTPSPMPGQKARPQPPGL